jgi:hypothetical protein
MIHALLRAGKPVIMVGLGSPYLMETFPEATTWLAAFSVADVSQRAAAQALLGTFAVSGKIPVSLPGATPHALRVGDGMTTAAIALGLEPTSAEMEERLGSVRDLLKDALSSGEIGSGAFVVGYRGRIATFAEGRYPKFVIDWLDRPELPTIVALLITQKQITLDTPLYRVLPEWIGTSDVERRKRVTVRHLLENTSGISAEQQKPPAENETPTLEALARDAVSLPLVAEPGTTVALNPDNAILLAEVVRRLTGKDVFAALGEHMPQLMGIPRVPYGEGNWLRTTPWAELAQLWLNGGIFAHHRYFTRALEEQLIGRRDVGGTKVIPGWDVPSAEMGLADLLSDQAFGSAQENDPSLWIDPRNNLFIQLDVGMLNGDKVARDRLCAQIYKAIFVALGLTP